MAGVVNDLPIILGLPDPNRIILGSGLVASPSLGAGAVNASITLNGSGIALSPSIGNGSLSTIINLTGASLSSPASIGNGTLLVGGVNVIDDETDDYPATIGAGSIGVGPVSLPGSALVDSVDFGLGEVTIGGISILDESNDHYAATLGTGSLYLNINLGGSSIGLTSSFGAGGVTPGPVTINGYGIPPETQVGRGLVRPTYIYFVGPKLTYAYGRRNSNLWWVEQRDGISLLKLSGVWTEVMYPTGDEIAAAEKAFRGGYRTPISGAEKAELVAAGYGSYIEEE